MAELKLEPFNGALEVKLEFYRPIQKSVSKIEYRRRAIGSSLPIVKADTDNSLNRF